MTTEIVVYDLLRSYGSQYLDKLKNELVYLQLLLNRLVEGPCDYTISIDLNYFQKLWQNSVIPFNIILNFEKQFIIYCCINVESLLSNNDRIYCNVHKNDELSSTEDLVNDVNKIIIDNMSYLLKID